MVDAAKQSSRDLRRLDTKLRRAQWWRQIKCFWTRPFRHEYIECENDAGEGAYEPLPGTNTTLVCVGCGKQRL